MTSKDKNNNKDTTEGNVTDPFLISAINLFSRERNGHMSRFAFTHPHSDEDPVRGTEYWDKFITSSDDYYLYSEEVSLIKTKAKRIVSHLPDNISVIELGPGPLSAVTEKTVPLLETFNKSACENKKDSPKDCKKISKYVALDISSQYAEQAKNKIAEEFGIETDHIVSDFTEEDLQISKSANATPVMVLFGGTLFNGPTVRDMKPERVIQSYLDHVRDLVGPNGYLIITQDTNNDEKTLMDAYKHKMNAKAALSILHRISRDLDVSEFSGYDFENAIRWNPDKSLLSLNAISKVDKEFSIGGVPFKVKKGEEFPLVNSFKYSSQRFKKIAGEAGFEVLDTMKDGRKGKIALHILRAGPA